MHGSQITVPNMNTIITTFFSEISQQTLKMYEKMAIMNQIWQSQILFYVYQWPMLPDHGTEYEENPSSHHEQMHNYGRMDWQTKASPIVPNSA